MLGLHGSYSLVQGQRRTEFRSNSDAITEDVIPENASLLLPCPREERIRIVYLDRRYSSNAAPNSANQQNSPLARSDRSHRQKQRGSNYCPMAQSKTHSANTRRNPH